MKDLKKVIRNLRGQNQPGLSLFLTGGYPSLSEFREILRLVDQENLADFVEIGIPFSDPLADGTVIQKTSSLAIRKGAAFDKILAEIKKADVKIPLVLMTYLNPLIAGGIRESLSKAGKAGFSAVIVPDLPLEESDEIIKISNELGIGLVLLAAPSTPAERISKISQKSSPFLYYVSTFGVTGMRDKLAKDISIKLKLVQKYSKVPVYCGFGISNAGQAELVGRYADGIIIGSALMKLISGPRTKYFKQIRKFAISIRQGLVKSRKK